MDAAEALKEIGFWLEREQAVTYKVAVFRKAAAIIAEPEETYRLAMSDRIATIR